MLLRLEQYSFIRPPIGLKYQHSHNVVINLTYYRIFATEFTVFFQVAAVFNTNSTESGRPIHLFQLIYQVNIAFFCFLSYTYLMQVVQHILQSLMTVDFFSYIIC